MAQESCLGPIYPHRSFAYSRNLTPSVETQIRLYFACGNKQSNVDGGGDSRGTRRRRIFGSILELSVTSNNCGGGTTLGIDKSVGTNDRYPSVIVAHRGKSVINLRRFEVSRGVGLNQGTRSGSTRLASTVGTRHRGLVPELRTSSISPRRLTDVITGFISLTGCRRDYTYYSSLAHSLSTQLFNRGTNRTHGLSGCHGRLARLDNSSKHVRLNCLVRVRSSFRKLYVRSKAEITHLSDKRYPLCTRVCSLLFGTSYRIS